MRINYSKQQRDEIIPYVIECICLRYSEQKALAYLKQKGFKISQRTYYIIKKEIQEGTQSRLHLIASDEFLTQHVERLDMLKTIQSKLWDSYNECKNPMDKAKILMQIAELQLYLSQYYDSTQYVLQRAVLQKKKKQLEEEQEQEQS